MSVLCDPVYNNLIHMDYIHVAPGNVRNPSRGEFNLSTTPPLRCHILPMERQAQ